MGRFWQVKWEAEETRRRPRPGGTEIALCVLREKGGDRGVICEGASPVGFSPRS